jgi:hypothetical protein
MLVLYTTPDAVPICWAPQAPDMEGDCRLGTGEYRFDEAVWWR